jgi:hypothetical protein
MGGDGRPTVSKRQRELARQRKKLDKAAERAQRKRDKANRPEQPDGVDHDIAGIVPGPQPSPWADEQADEDVAQPS